MRQRVQSARRWVVKVGSSLLTDDGRGLDHELISAWTEDLANMLNEGIEVVLVSSGSIAEGLVRLGWNERPDALADLQAAAAVGQMGLIQAYEAGFKRYDRLSAQILLTHEDLANRKRYLNARATINTLIKHGVLPIVNENDTVTTAEIRLGDNDTLAAQVANLIEADVLVLLTDQAGLFTKDPREHSDATLVERADASDPAIKALAGDRSGKFGKGGMATKILAAERAAESGTTTLIASGREARILARLNQGEPIGTMLTSEHAPRDARKRWLSSQLRSKGVVTLDKGACEVLQRKGSSLLAIGVIKVSGEFQRGELVSCVDQHGTEIARGLINYNHSDASRIIGKSSHEFMHYLGYSGEPELIHRDNLVLNR
ncbi:MAG: glutamate 5-kinase [Gammaproteobacteria bacterium]|nr:glutamate 5-kinase [Gammaproteobacteria bacterium]